MNEQSNRRWLRFSLRSLFVVVTLFALALAWRQRPPRVKLALDGPAVLITPENSSTGTSFIEFPLRITNYGKSSAWVSGYSANLPLYNVYTRKPGFSQWVEPSPGLWCGTGLGRHYIEDQSSVAFRVEVPAKLAGQQMRVVVHVCEDSSDNQSFAISSDPIAIPEPRGIAAKF
jgi:hypothetical protein